MNMGLSHETVEFARERIRRWCKQFGCTQYSNASGILICADGGESNGIRRRAWKYFLQQLSDEIVILITVCHYSPGTGK